MLRRPILIIHPNDSTTSFLDKIKNYLIESLGDSVHHFNVQTNESSHSECLERIQGHSENGIIIFLGHGRSDTLYGSRGDLYGTFENGSIKLESPERYYYNENFINSSNIQIFNGKKVFCLACNSNSKIAKYALNAGAKTFLGFGDIPTSPEEFKEDGIENVSSEIVKAMKTELNYIVKMSLVKGMLSSFSFKQLQDLIHFIVNKRISEYLMNKKDFRERHLLTDYLYLLKKEMLIWGDKRLKLIE